ncbi:MAG: HD domain-containing phosphohydrolase [Acidobacteriota bacterium]
MSDTRGSAKRRFKLEHVLFLALLLSGSIPLLLNSVWLMRQNRGMLESQERVALASSGQLLSQRIDSFLDGFRRQLVQLGEGLLAAEGQPGDEPLRQAWVRSYLRSVAESRREILAIRVLDARGVGPTVEPRDLPAGAEDALRAAYRRARQGTGEVYEVVRLPGQDVPVTVLAVPIRRDAGEPRLVVEALLELSPLNEVYGEPAGEPAGGDGLAGQSVFLIGKSGEVLWSRGASAEVERALVESRPVVTFWDRPLAQSSQYSAEVQGKRREILVRMSPIDEAGWVLVAQRPLARAFDEIDRMVLRTAVSSLVLALLALFFAGLFARRFGPPIERLAEATGEIASGRFDERVPVAGLSLEMRDLGEDFNRMAEHVESHVARLRRAAEANRELFIGTLRALTAAIDAKDPYTRGHSERVAAVSRVIAARLGLSEEQQQSVWISALVHDVGKIGIDDRILKKGDVLTEAEFEEMKRHPVIGAEIMESIEPLRNSLPAIRWHHECWNGRGYPDGLRGEGIPLEARIVSVADTFDAITTNRPYQEAYTLEFAVETITRLAGSRFDAKIVTAFLKAYESGEIAVSPAARAATEDEVGGAPQEEVELISRVWQRDEIDEAEETVAAIS